MLSNITILGPFAALTLLSATVAVAEEGIYEEIPLACEIRCGSLYGSKTLSFLEEEYLEENSLVKMTTSGEWVDNVFYTSPARFTMHERLCKVLKKTLAHLAFGEIAPVETLDLPKCQTKPIAFGRFGLYKYPVKPELRKKNIDTESEL